MTKQVVFLDLDGTLLLRDGTMPASAREALQKATAQGHEMVICTGRSSTQIAPVLEEDADLFGGVVASAGANVTRNRKVVWRGALSAEKTQELVDFFRKYKIAYFLQAESGIYAENACMDAIFKAFRELGRSPEEVQEIFGETVLSDTPEDVPYIEKCCYFHCPMEADQVQKELGDYFNVVDSSYKISRFCDGEVCRAGVTKAFGMEQYLKAAGVSRENCIAFGDGPNDFEMVEFAHTGVCMGNGTPGLKAVADRVAGHIEEDGLYNEFKALGLFG